MLPIAGHLDATITATAPVIIHGDRYVDLAIEANQPNGANRERTAVRVPMHALGRMPEVGDRVRLKVLLGQVDAVEFLS